MIRVLAVVTLSVAMSAFVGGRGQTAVERPFPLVDEAAQDPTFVAFRARLLDIVSRRDLKSLLDVTSPTIMFSFGQGPGIERFQRYYGLDDGKSELWAELGRVLSLGGTFQGPDMFVAPYVYSRWPEELAEATDYVAVTAAETPVYERPSVEAAVVRRIGPNIVLTSYDDKVADKWHRVLLLDGRTGYVARTAARSPIDTRAFFARMPEGWMMVILVAGD